MKVYVVYEQRYGDLLVDCSPCEILGVYKEISSAKKEVEKQVQDNLIYNYVLDYNNLDDNNNLRSHDYVTMYYGENDNFNCYFELMIKEMNVN